MRSTLACPSPSKGVACQDVCACVVDNQLRLRHQDGSSIQSLLQVVQVDIISSARRQLDLSTPGQHSRPGAGSLQAAARAQ